MFQALPAASACRSPLAGLARADTQPQRQAKPLNAEPLGTTQTADRRGRVDVAICAVLRDGLLRRSEAADLRWEDVTFQASGARGALFEVRRSKTCWPSGRPTLTRRPWSSGSPTDRSDGGCAPQLELPAWRGGWWPQ